MIRTLKSLIISLWLIIGVASQAHANLIVNGSFEDIGDSVAMRYGKASTWQIYSSIPEWDATQNVEIWNNDFIVPAFDGNRVLELNAHPGDANGSFSIFQEFSTIVGQVYNLEFAGRKRQKRSDEAFSVEVGNLSESIYNQTWGTWNEYSFQFTALTDVSRLTFTSLDGGLDTTGNIFDAIVVTTAEVPEPNTLFLMVIAASGLILVRARS